MALVISDLKRTTPQTGTTLIRAGDRRQRSDNGFHQRCQRNGKEHAPKAPQTAKKDNRYNNHQRMQINRFREQQRH